MASSAVRKKSRSVSSAIFFQRLAGGFGEYVVESLLEADDFFGLDFNVGGLALEAADVGLVHMHGGVGQAVPLALFAVGEQDGGHAGGGAYADGGDLGVDQPHSVQDGQARGDVAAGAVDVEADVPVAILALQVKELGNDDIGYLVGDGRAEVDDALAEQQGVDVKGALAPGPGFDDHRHDVGGREQRRVVERNGHCGLLVKGDGRRRGRRKGTAAGLPGGGAGEI